MRAKAIPIIVSLALPTITAEGRCGSTDLPAQQRISNGVLSLATCTRDAGAVCSIVYGGHEFVNDYDHGRQLQVAWSYNDAGEGYNPTEAGSSDDATSPGSTSELLAVQVEKNSISTRSHPAYWRKPGRGINTAKVTKDTLEKTVTLGYQGNPHVIVVDSAVTVAQEPTGPAVTRMRTESPAFYTSSALTQHYQLDRRTGLTTKIPPPAAPDARDRMNRRMGHNVNRELVPILASVGSDYAVAAYTPKGEGFWTYSTYNIPSDAPANACNKVTVRFDHSATAGSTYSYRSFVVVGNLSTVIDTVMKLP